MNSQKKYGGLTEAEILAQPESEYMSKAQLAFFREKLVELRDNILHNATDTGEHLRDTEVATDPSDRATQEEEYTLELRTRDRERKLLKKVDKSLRMVDDGSFGWCEETGEPIGIARLIARPTASLSIEAQSYIMWSYVDGLTHPEIAARVGLATSQINGRITRAREKLRKRLEELCSSPEQRTSIDKGFDTWVISLRRRIGEGGSEEDPSPDR